MYFLTAALCQSARNTKHLWGIFKSTLPRSTNSSLLDCSKTWTLRPMKTNTALKCTFRTLAKYLKGIHSICVCFEMTVKLYRRNPITIVPILVGSIDKGKETLFGKILAPFLQRNDTFCVVSSDFCHWGLRFSYTYYYSEPPSDKTRGIRLSRSNVASAVPSYPIHESISALDHQAMSILTFPPTGGSQAHDEFTDYLARTRNTICGRHPIGVLLGALGELEQKGVKSTMHWVKYEQSSKCVELADSSVSYASAYVSF